MSGSSPLTAAEIVDIRRFCGYPLNPLAGPTPAQLALSLTILADRQPGPLLPTAVAALLQQFAAAGTPVTGDALSQAIALLSPEQVAVVRATYLAQLYPLETAITAAASRLSTASAAVWTRNPTEIQDRERLFRSWRLRLCWFLSIESGGFLDEMLPAAFIV